MADLDLDLTAAIEAAVDALTQHEWHFPNTVVSTDGEFHAALPAYDIARAALAAAAPLIAEQAARQHGETIAALHRLHADYEGRCAHCVEWCNCLDHNEFARVADCTHGNVPWPCPTVAAIARTTPPAAHGTDTGTPA
jgi:hypothetical protein